jgi:hypothetical protein
VGNTCDGQVFQFLRGLGVWYLDAVACCVERRQEDVMDSLYVCTHLCGPMRCQKVYMQCSGLNARV